MGNLEEYIEGLKEAKLKVDGDLVELHARFKRLREALEASHNGTICPLCHSMPHSSTCPAIVALEGEHVES